MTVAASGEKTTAGPAAVLVPFGIGAAVAVAAGVYGRVHDPTFETPYRLFFSGTINLKSWFTTLILVLAGFQVISALRIYGRLGSGAPPSWFGQLHRLSGTLAFALTLPVAYHCLWALGFRSDLDDVRTVIHSVAGCFFYGVFVAKVLVVRNHRLPGWALPVVGGVTFTSLVVLWLSSSLWFFTSVDFPGV